MSATNGNLLTIKLLQSQVGLTNCYMTGCVTTFYFIAALLILLMFICCGFDDTRKRAFCIINAVIPRVSGAQMSV